MNKCISFLLLFIVVFSLNACSNQQDPSASISNVTVTDLNSPANTNLPLDTVNDTTEEENTLEINQTALSDQITEESENNPSVMDYEIGLRNVKIDSSSHELNENQKIVLQYFDEDYLTVPNYEFLRRYPNVFDNAQIYIWGSIEKVLSMDQNHYKALLWLNVGTFDRNEGSTEDKDGNYILIEGETGDNWYIEHDQLAIYGQYVGIENIEVDGTSYTIPHVIVYRSVLDQGISPSYAYHFIPKYDNKFIKKVATIVFGNNMELRNLDMDIDLPRELIGLFDPENYLVVTLDNQSNSKFQKFFLSTEAGEIIVADKTSLSSGVDRYLEFAADFQHYYMLSHNKTLNSLTLECYDTQLNKIWKREFEDAYYSFADFGYSGVYDYTSKNVYLIVNNELYTINTENGEDSNPPYYVGKKIAIRKLEDSILLISDQKADGIMKYDLNGNILWKTSIPTDISSLNGIQIINHHIIMRTYYWNSPDDSGTHYLVLDEASGDLLTDAVSYSS